jgi:anti-sigma regulatory factor (Ser/Thr protein kinase)
LITENEEARSFRRSDPATPNSVPRLRTAVAGFLTDSDVADDLVQTIKLAVSEALTNVVLHAYPEGRAGPVHVSATVRVDQVEVTVSDEGGGMAPRTNSPGAGLGLPIIAQLAASVEISHGAGDGTELRMSFDR